MVLVHSQILQAKTIWDFGYDVTRHIL